MPHALVVRCAGQKWILEFDSDRIRDEVARWLGPWSQRPPVEGSSRPRREDPDQIAAGTIAFISCTELSKGNEGLRRHSEGISLRSQECEILTREGGLMPRGEVRFRERAALDAVRLALRVLVTRAAFARGAVPLHAASVMTSEGTLVFVGPKGAGKTAARLAFPPEARLDDDLVLLARSADRWFRLDLFDRDDPRRFGPSCAGEFPVRAVLRPGPGSEFRFVPLKGGEAFRACLHVPAYICVSGEEEAVRDASTLLSRLDGLVKEVLTARFEWALGEDLPALLEDALRRSGGQVR